jgi:hypothetical protein
MTGAPAAAAASLTFGAAIWPLLAGLSVVLWSKARAARPVAVIGSARRLGFGA